MRLKLTLCMYALVVCSCVRGGAYTGLRYRRRREEKKGVDTREEVRVNSSLCCDGHGHDMYRDEDVVSEAFKRLFNVGRNRDAETLSSSSKDETRSLRYNAELVCTMTGLRRAAAWLNNRELYTIAFAGACMAGVGLFLSAASMTTSVAATWWCRIASAVLGWVALIPLALPSLEECVLHLTVYDIDMHVLMSVAAFAAAALGTPAEGALLLLMFKSAHAIEHLCSPDTNVGRAASELAPPMALRVAASAPAIQQESMTTTKAVDSDERMREVAATAVSVSVEELAVGDTVLVRCGDVAPVDGEIVRGRCLLNVEHLTGESVPVRVIEGESVAAGSIATDGDFLLCVMRAHADSTLVRISRLAEEAAQRKPSIQRWLDTVTGAYSKFVLIGSIAAFALLALRPSLSLNEAARRALGFLVAASPCALAAAPLSYAAAMSACARKGIIIRGGRILDAIANCNVVAFDKTGTLTTGDLELVAVQCGGGEEEQQRQEEKESDVWTPDIAVTVAAKMEHGVSHPIARALEREYAERVSHAATHSSPLAEIDVTDVRIVAGEGVSARVRLPGMHEACTAYLGRPSFASSGHHMGGSDGESSIHRRQSIEDAHEAHSHEKKHGSTGAGAAAAGGGGRLGEVVLCVGSGRTCHFSFRDELREGSKGAVDALQGDLGVEVMMLTGDSEAAALGVAQETGISPEATHAALSPSDKVDTITRLQQQGGKRVLMVGEGVNDAPALAASTVGATLSERASAASVAAADILVVRDDAAAVVETLRAAARAVSLVRVNVVIALVGIFGAAAASIAGSLPLWLTVFIHEGGTVLVVFFNAVLCATT